MASNMSITVALFSILRQIPRLVVGVLLSIIIFIAAYISLRVILASKTIDLPDQLCDATHEQLEKFNNYKMMYRSQGILRPFGIDSRSLNDVFFRSQDVFESPEGYIIGLHALMKAVGGTLLMTTNEFLPKNVSPILTSYYAIDPYRVGYINISSYVLVSVSPEFKSITEIETNLAHVEILMMDFGISLTWPPNIATFDYPSINQAPPTNKCMPIAVTDGMRTWIETYRAQRARQRHEESSGSAP